MAHESTMNRQLQLDSTDLLKLSVISLLLISRPGKILKANKSALKLFDGNLDLEGILIQRLFSVDPPFELTDLLSSLLTDTSSSEQILLLGVDKETSFWASVHFTCLSNLPDTECV